jgi:2-amino-4-hydroxy-6-hydroxymethyldihydropteridine diphosphokinase/dihydropteroate synthase
MPIVLLGLGTNQGNRIQNLRTAITKVRQIDHTELTYKSSVFQSEALLKPNSPKEWNIDYFNCCISIRTILSPIDLLVKIKNIEAEMGRNFNGSIWSPRVIDIDILTWEDHIYQDEKLCIPHMGLLERSFVLIPLLQIDPLWIHPRFPDIDLHIRVKNYKPLAYANFRLNKPKLMGILNLSSDSFSGDGIDVDNLEDIKLKFIELVNTGSEVIDIGAISSKPGAKYLSPEQEWNILKPVLNNLNEWLNLPELMTQPKISIDTYRDQIVEKLFDYPIDFINDISGRNLDKICALIKNKSIKYIIMHNCGESGSDYLDLKVPAINQILSFFKEKKEQMLSYGLALGQIIFDVGIGFGKHPFQAENILDNLRLLEKLNIEIVVGHSRKASVMPSVSDLKAEHRDFETALVSYDASQCVNYLRVHNVELSQRALCH